MVSATIIIRKENSLDQIVALSKDAKRVKGENKVVTIGYNPENGYTDFFDETFVTYCGGGCSDCSSQGRKYGEVIKGIGDEKEMAIVYVPPTAPIPKIVNPLHNQGISVDYVLAVVESFEAMNQEGSPIKSWLEVANIGVAPPGEFSSENWGSVYDDPTTPRQWMFADGPWTLRHLGTYEKGIKYAEKPVTPSTAPAGVNLTVKKTE